MKGLIRNTAKVTRGIDFSGLNSSSTMAKGSVYASDIDAIMEFNDKHVIMVEIKEEGVPLKMGQRLLLSRLCNAWNQTGRQGIVLFATHSPDIVGNVGLTQCTVKETYSSKWTKADNGSNLLEALQLLGDEWNITKLKKQ